MAQNAQVRQIQLHFADSFSNSEKSATPANDPQFTARISKAIYYLHQYYRLQVFAVSKPEDMTLLFGVPFVVFVLAVYFVWYRKLGNGGHADAPIEAA
ncbi:hypothetical protein GCM10027419_22040 [Pandoraea terrae]